MESLKDTSVLKFEPFVLEKVRKMYNLDQPGRMAEAINIIQEWIQKQDHFKCKNFERDYLERFIIINKGLLERVKTRLDKKCTVVNLTKLLKPQNVRDLKNLGVITHGVVPRLTKDMRRIYIIKFKSQVKESETWNEMNKTNIMALEYYLKHDYQVGIYAILDYRFINITGVFISSFNISDMREYLNISMGTYGISVKSIHIITSSRMAGAVVAVLKQAFSSYKHEIYVHSDLEDLYKYIPKELLPADYGGEEDTLENIEEKWKVVLSSEEHLKHMQWVNEARTDETRRTVEKFNELYLGTPGTFRSLNVD